MPDFYPANNAGFRDSVTLGRNLKNVWLMVTFLILSVLSGNFV